MTCDGRANQLVLLEFVWSCDHGLPCLKKLNSHQFPAHQKTADLCKNWGYWYCQLGCWVAASMNLHELACWHSRPYWSRFRCSWVWFHNVWVPRKVQNHRIGEKHTASRDIFDRFGLAMKYWYSMYCTLLSYPNCGRIWTNQYMAVSINGGTPKSSIWVGFSIINHPF